MSKFRKTDWLRNLYRESVKWTSGHSGRVQWHDMTPEVRDPNNGSRLTIRELEGCLPDKLRKCISNTQVPSVYKPEVETFLKYIDKVEKFNDKVIAEKAHSRKIAISLVEVSQNFVKLNASEKDLIIATLPAGMGEKTDTILLEIQSMTASVAGLERGRETEENKKQFKSDDWMRHMYLCCQKWLQMQPIRDPNNKKKGEARMNSNEVKQLLMELAPQCLHQDVIPKPYLAEMEEVVRVSEKGGQFKDIEVKERLRLIAVRLTDVIGLAEPFNILQVCHAIGQAKDTLKEVLALEKAEGIESTEEHVEQPSSILQVQALEKAEGIQSTEEQVEQPSSILQVPALTKAEGIESTEEHVEQPSSTILQVNNALDLCEDMFKEGQGLEKSDKIEENVYIEPLHDGTEELMDIIDQACTTEACSYQTVADCVQSDYQEMYPSSPSIGFSEGLSEVASPLSACSTSLDGHVSDDSGISSPTGNHFGLEDPEIPEDLKIAELLGLKGPEEYADIDVDTSELPDVTPYMNNNNGKLKRKLPDEFDKPQKKPRP